MNVLIIGKYSYIGNHIDEWMSLRGHKITQLDVLTDEWRTFDYSTYDAIVHVAGIVHRPGCNDSDLYKRVNTDMPVEIATMAKAAGVNQYVFLSTMGVYGAGKLLRRNMLDETTPLGADDLYGRSKLLAEEGLRALQDVDFSIACVRPPIVYGKGCRGGYIKGFVAIVKKLPVIPRAFEEVRQSFIYIDNLCELIRIVVEKRLNGVFCPQDEKAVNAIELMSAIAKGLGRKNRESQLLGYLIQAISFMPLVKKAYGGVEYSKSLSCINSDDYIVVPFEEGIRRTLL